MAAGGLTTRASACDMLLARPTDPCSCRVTLPVCYRAITQLGDTTTNYQLRPGDRIFVGRQTLIEEVLPCCSQRTCQRCCDNHCACRDPRIAELQGASFKEPVITSITTNSLGMLTDTEPSQNTDEVQRQTNEQELLRPTEQDTMSREILVEPTLSEPILDGELEFGDFLKNESKR